MLLTSLENSNIVSYMNMLREVDRISKEEM